MRSIWCRRISVIFLITVTAMAQVSPEELIGEEDFQDSRPREISVPALLAPTPPTKAAGEEGSAAGERPFRQLAAHFVQEETVMVNVLQSRLARLQQSLMQLLRGDPTGLNRIPLDSAATGLVNLSPYVIGRPGDQIASDSGLADSNDVIGPLSDVKDGFFLEDFEKKRNGQLSPTQRVMVRREIMRRLEEMAPPPLDLLGMRLKKFSPDAAADFENLDQLKKRGEALPSSHRDAIRAAILRHLNQRREAENLQGMRGGK